MSKLCTAEHAVTYSDGWVRKGSKRIMSGLRKTNKTLVVAKLKQFYYLKWMVS